MLTEHSMVKSTKQLSDNVPLDCVGTVVFTGTEPQGYLVEFFDLEGDTIDILAVTPSDIKEIDRQGDMTDK